MSTIIFVAQYVLVPYAVFIFLFMSYIAIMSLRDMRDAGKLTLFDKVLGYPGLLIGYALDLIANILITLIFLEIPREKTVSERALRLARLPQQPKGWRYWLPRWRRWLARLLLSVLQKFDKKGGHDVPKEEQI
jgi:hypothetical protein